MKALNKRGEASDSKGLSFSHLNKYFIHTSLLNPMSMTRPVSVSNTIAGFLMTSERESTSSSFKSSSHGSVSDIFCWIRMGSLSFYIKSQTDRENDLINISLRSNNELFHQLHWSIYLFVELTEVSWMKTRWSHSRRQSQIASSLKMRSLGESTRSTRTSAGAIPTFLHFNMTS